MKMKELESKHGLPEIELYDFAIEEERDVQAVQIFMKKYSKLWKFLYNKYANSCFSIDTNAPNFDKLKNKYDHINLAELRKMLDDYGFDKKKFLTKDELQTLVKLVNFKVMKKFEPRQLEFDGFKEWILQTAIYMYTKPGPNDYSAFPALKHLELLVEKMKKEATLKGQNTILFDDPDAISISDPDLLIALNKKLEQDPDYPVPEGFTK